MKFRPTVAAPFEVSRHVTFDTYPEDAFCGHIALTALRNAWAQFQKPYNSPWHGVPHPQLSVARIVLLHSSETGQALQAGENDNNGTVYDKRKARKLYRQLAKAGKGFPPEHVVPSTHTIIRETDASGGNLLVMPITAPGAEAGAAALELEAERNRYFEVLQEVTGKERLAVSEPLPIAIHVARLPNNFNDDETEALRKYIQSKIEMDEVSDPNAFSHFTLGPPEIVS